MASDTPGVHCLCFFCRQEFSVKRWWKGSVTFLISVQCPKALPTLFSGDLCHLLLPHEIRPVCSEITEWCFLLKFKYEFWIRCELEGEKSWMFFENLLTQVILRLFKSGVLLCQGQISLSPHFFSWGQAWHGGRRPMERKWRCWAFCAVSVMLASSLTALAVQCAQVQWNWKLIFFFPDFSLIIWMHKANYYFSKNNYN